MIVSSQNNKGSCKVILSEAKVIKVQTDSTLLSGTPAEGISSLFHVNLIHFSILNERANE